MKLLTRNFSKVLLAGSIIFLSSCNKDDNDSQDSNMNNKKTTVKGVFESESQYSMMNDAVEQSNQSEFFSKSDANITVFAANNDAWNQLFAEMNVNSMSELKTKMGDEAFANLVLYQAINGRFEASDVNDGFSETNARNSDNERLSVYIKNEGSGHLMLNGDDDNGAMTTGSATIGATNGTIIEVDAVLRGQSNLENVEDGKDQTQSGLFVDVLANSNASTRNMLDDESSESMVLVAQDAQVQGMLNVYLKDIMDEDDLSNLLDANAQTTLYTMLGVNTMSEVLAQVTIDDLLSLNTVTVADIFAELDADDNSELMSNFIFSGNYDLESEAANNGTITSEAGIAYNVSMDAQNRVVLTDSDNNTIILNGKTAESVNGSVYTVADVQKHQ